MLRNDSSTYDLPARSLLKTGRLAVEPDAPDSPMIIRTPGYPCFIALVYLVFGESHVAVGLVQIVLSALTIVMVYYISRVLWDSTAAITAATLFSLDVVSLVSSLYLLTETLFTFFLTASVGAGVLLGLARWGRMRWAFLSGLLLALTILVRPIAYLSSPWSWAGSCTDGWRVGSAGRSWPSSC
ncbi:MAG: glycosyltransferase family 39 protein [Phycisphaerae bacterium]